MFSVFIAGVISLILVFVYIFYLVPKRQFKELSLAIILLLIGAWMYFGMLNQWPLPNPLIVIELAVKPINRILHMWIGGSPI